MPLKTITGDILGQKVDVVVNSWNRNIIPWWLLLPQGVSGAIKRYGGTEPFRELSKFGPIPTGGARLTSAGKLPFKAIIHVAGINLFWVATEYSVSHSVINAMKIVHDLGYSSVAFPLIGSGSGNRGKNWSKNIMLKTLESIDTGVEIYLVEYG